ncbi:hypothetical protein IWW36_002232 [Coemansia brasiliensis]|uniref:Uncharacterized protein n=1 Tax=Coemansia brasiliensis TaxID=2650707 RepID=A0A9W8I7M9_9FUNG|nr:hypothetical protein IWW36_002232 [Coemansia brasiliensis]
MNTAGLSASTTSSNGLRALPRSITGANSLVSPTSPTTAAALTLASSGLLNTANQQPIVLTPGQFAVECGGVLLDPATNEVCLLFYPDSSEWRLPMGRSDVMSGSEQQQKPFTPANECSMAGCEPMSHAAQRLISKATGYRCSHLHPSVSSNAKQNPCAYIGPQMVEPLALQIEQRAAQPETASPSSSRGSPDAFDFSGTGLLSEPASSTADEAPPGKPDAREQGHGGGQLEGIGNALGLVATENDSGYQQPRSGSANASQFVMTYYYMAWLTQNRFESRAATHPVGPATDANQQPDSSNMLLADSTTNRLQQQQQQPRTLPLAEVTWFKVDTAAQVLTNASDKVALREAINRLTRLAMPEPPFAYSAALAGQSQAEQAPDLQKPQQQQQQPAATNTDNGNAQPSSSSASSASLSDGATKAENTSASASRLLMPPSSSSNSRNIDILRKTATSISKRGGSIFKKRANNLPEANDDDAEDAAGRQLTTTAQSPPAAATSPSHKPIIVPRKNAMPRMFSIFYKIVGSSSA